jgi:uncharacterized protein (TIGR00159 family)
MLLGLAVVFLVYLISRVLGLYTLHWLLDNFLSSIILVIVVIFQGDIRRALIHFGKNPFYTDDTYREQDEVLDQIVKACTSMAKKQVGALIVLERETGLNDFLEVGVELDAKISSDLIVSIFLPYSPIHDGALVIQKGRISRAGCFLPLAQNPDISKNLGTRHRAAIGLTELVDAAVIVVSEETGRITIVVAGKMTKNLDAISLRRVLKRLLDSNRTRLHKQAL